MSTMMTGKELRGLREKAKLTRRQLALFLNCTENTIYQWESGINKIKKIYEIALRKEIAEHGASGGDQ